MWWSSLIEHCPKEKKKRKAKKKKKDAKEKKSKKGKRKKLEKKREGTMLLSFFQSCDPK